MNKYKALLLLCAAFSLLLLINIGMVPALAQRVIIKGEKDKLSVPPRADVTAPIRARITPAQISRSQVQVSRSQIKPSRINVPNGTGPGSLNYIDELEPNNTVATAQFLGGNLSHKVKGTMQPSSDVDYYAFGAFAGDRVYAATQTIFSLGSGLTSNTTIELYSTDGTTLLDADGDDGSFNINASSIAGTTLPNNGTYFIKVINSTSSQDLCPYDLYVGLQFGSPQVETEPNNNAGPPNSPNPLSSSRWVSGVISPAADNDVFSVSLNAGDTVYISLDPNPERDATTWNPRIGFGLFDSFFLLADDANTVSPNSEALFFTVREAGTYLIYVDEPTGAGGAAFTYQLSVKVFPQENLRTCTTYTSTDVPKAIPIAAGLATSTVNVGAALIGNVRVSLNITHSALGELDVSLTAPEGNEVVLFDDLPAASAGTTAPQINFTLDDEAGLPVALVGVNKSMIYQPDGPGRLYWFKNQQSGGNWTLKIRDDAGVGSGTLNGWSVTVCSDPPISNCQVAPTIVLSTDFEANDGGFTHSGAGAGDEWERGLPTFAPITTCHSGTNCWKTDLDNTYNNASPAAHINSELASSNLDLSGLAGQRIIVFWAMKYQIESSGFDNAYLEVREVGGSGLTRKVWEWAGPTMNRSVGSPAVTINSAAGWGTWHADISDFGNKVVRLVFHLDQDDSVALAGLAIDDVSVRACSVAGPLPSSAVSRKTHAPNAGTFDIAMPLTGTAGIECRNGGATGDHTLVVTFPNPVNVSGNPQADVTSGTGDVGSGGVANGGVISGNGTSVITVPLTNIANVQTIVVTLFDVFDGFSSSGNISIPMSVLIGDTTGNKAVNSSDVSQVKAASGTTQASRKDVTVNGLVNASDVSLVKAKSGTGLP